MRMVSERELKGRRIVGFDAHPVRVEGRIMHNPVIRLDDGSFLIFTAEEAPDGGDYGVFVGRSKSRGQPS